MVNSEEWIFENAICGNNFAAFMYAMLLHRRNTIFAPMSFANKNSVYATIVNKITSRIFSFSKLALFFE
jgi:hypothetical protein